MDKKILVIGSMKWRDLLKMTNEKIVRRQVLSSIPRFKIYTVLSFLQALVIQMVALVPPLLMQRIIDQYIPARELVKTLWMVFLFFLIPVIAAILNTMYNYVLNIVGKRCGQQLTMMAFQKLIYQPMSYFDRQNSAELTTYCRTEAMNYIVFWLFNLPQLLASIAGGMIVFILLIRAQWILACSMLLYFPLTWFPSRFFSKKIESFVKYIVENNAKSAQILTDTFRGIRTVKAMTLEKIQLHKMQRINSDTVRVWSKVTAIDNLNGYWGDTFVESLFSGLIFACGAVFIIRGQLTLGVLVLIQAYMPRLFSVFKSITSTNFHFRQQLANYDKLFSIIAMPDEYGQYMEKKPFAFNDAIVFDHITFAYTEERGPVLTDFSIAFQQGQWIGLVGPSGAGKSTVFDLLLRLYEPQEGNITIDGVSIKDIDLLELRSCMTKVSQDPFLFPGTIEENLHMVAPNATNDELWQALELAGVAAFVRGLSDGLQTNIGENGVQISGGEKQRLCIAQGLLRRSPVLLLDEVSANIDPETEASIRDTLRSLKEKNNLTILSISHRFDFLKYADVIYSLSNGKVETRLFSGTQGSADYEKEMR